MLLELSPAPAPPPAPAPAVLLGMPPLYCPPAVPFAVVARRSTGSTRSAKVPIVSAADLGLVVNALAAIGSVGAAFAALYIATRDRSERRRERDAADEAQARLVQVDVDRPEGEAAFVVRIRNYGDRAIIGPAVEGASLNKRPDAQWKELNEWIDILPPYREAAFEGTLPLRFFDAEGDPVPKLLALVGDMAPLFEDVDEKPIVAVHFMDANGNYWTTGPFMDPERGTLRRRRWRWFRRRRSLAEELAKS
jgi:hypothetical protein